MEAEMTLDNPNSPVDEIARDLAAMAILLNHAEFNPSSSFRFDIMTESVIWDDELPQAYSGNPILLALRPIFYQRACLLIGQQDELTLRYWKLGLELFPSWPGFRPERLDPTSEAALYLRTRREEIDRSIENRKKRYKPAQTAVPTDAPADPRAPGDLV